MTGELEPRVGRLEHRADALEQALETVRNDHAETRRRVEHVESLLHEDLREVRGAVSDVSTKVDTVRDSLAGRDTELAKEISEARHSWPTSAVVATTAALAIPAGLIVALVVALATHAINL